MGADSKRDARRKVRAVLFDAAGTLIDPSEPVGETYARVARHFGVEISPWRLGDAFRRIVRGAGPRLGRNAATDDIEEIERSWWRQIVRGTFLAADGTLRFRDFEGFFEALFGHFAEPDAWVLRAGVAEALPALRAEGLLLGIVSNFDHRLMKILEGLEITGFFETVQIPVACRLEKPDRRIFEVALQHLKVSAPEALYVGHHPRLDLGAASNAGLQTLDVAELGDLGELPARVRGLARRA